MIRLDLMANISHPSATVHTLYCVDIVADSQQKMVGMFFD